MTTKYFNTAGPCNKKEHYMVPLEERSKEVMSLINQKHYFVIHAARQTGKTTLLQSLMDYIELENKYYVLYCSLEAIQVFSEPKEGIPEILNVLKSAVKYSNLPHKDTFAKELNINNLSTLISDALRDFCKILDKPLVLFLDEVDGLQDKTMITFLRQMREGYITRNRIPFLHSVALVGMRNIRDYKTEVREGKDTLGSTSPFNIITDALSITNFSFSEIEALYLQHTQLSGQIFEKTAIERVFEMTNGQPWLVNAIARECISKILDNDFTQSVTFNLIDDAIQNIILRRDTHIDSLLDKLKDERIRKVIEPLILGKQNELNVFNDDITYCSDLGLIKIDKGEMYPANKIYSEIIIRTLTYNNQFHLITEIQNIWIDKTGKIDMTGLLKGFQQFWRENSDIWIDKYQYKEAAPHLILQAFLQRIVNGGGTILREYGANRQRIDLCVIYNNNKYPIELKIKYSQSVEEKGIQQLTGYMDSLGEKTGWLIIFDREPNKSWDEKIYWNIKNLDNYEINIVGC